jgi:hypothetical protein
MKSFVKICLAAFIILSCVSTTFAEDSHTSRQSQIENINAFIRPLKPTLILLQSTQKIDPVVKNAFIIKLSNLIASTNALKTRGNTTASTTELELNGKHIAMLPTQYQPLIRQVGQLIIADRILVTADMASITAGKIQTDLTNLKTAGKDVSALETSFAEVAPLLLSARTTATNSVVKINALNASSTSINSDISAIHQDEMHANQKLRQVNTIFRDLYRQILSLKDGVEKPNTRVVNPRRQ